MTALVLTLVALLGLLGVGAVVLVIVKGQSPKQTDIRGLMASSGQQAGNSAKIRGRDASDFDIENIKRISGSSVAKKGRGDDLATKLFKAGYFTADDKQQFHVIQVVVFVCSLIAIPTGIYAISHNGGLMTVMIVLAAFIGFVAPLSWLDRQVRFRQEETLYFLPLVIEQVSIGVSSSLDIGPCIANIVEMATERDAHNPVTEMFISVEKLMRSGLSLEESLQEVGDAFGMSEVKHAFMFLAQCARHGGEISKQLQELADSIMVQRQTQVEARIAALPVKATGPLVFVFAGFFILLFAGLIVRFKGAFG